MFGKAATLSDICYGTLVAKKTVWPSHLAYYLPLQVMVHLSGKK